MEPIQEFQLKSTKINTTLADRIREADERTSIPRRRRSIFQRNDLAGDEEEADPYVFDTQQTKEWVNRVAHRPNVGPNCLISDRITVRLRQTKHGNTATTFVGLIFSSEILYITLPPPLCFSNVDEESFVSQS